MTTAHETYTSAADYLTKRLRQELKALDEHDKETRRLLDNPTLRLVLGTFDGRDDKRLDLSYRIINTARALSVVLP